MIVTSHIYAQIDGSPRIHHIAEIEYTEGDFGQVSLRHEAVELVTGSILDMLEKVEGAKQELQGTPETEQLDRDA